MGPSVTLPFQKEIRVSFNSGHFYAKICVEIDNRGKCLEITVFYYLNSILLYLRALKKCLAYIIIRHLISKAFLDGFNIDMDLGLERKECGECGVIFNSHSETEKHMAEAHVEINCLICDTYEREEIALKARDKEKDDMIKKF